MKKKTPKFKNKKHLKNKKKTKLKLIVLFYANLIEKFVLIDTPISPPSEKKHLYI